MPFDWDKYGPAPPGTDDLSPLGVQLRTGLQVIGVLAVFSLILCSSLFFFITYRLIESRLRTRNKTIHNVRNQEATAYYGTDTANSLYVLEDPLINSKEPPTPMTTMAVTPTSPNCTSKSTSTEKNHSRGSGDSRRAAIPNIRQRYKGYHPLLVLIYMLLIADIIQSASFIPNLVWVKENGVRVRTETCWAQGWLRSQGDMASSLFAAAVSVNTWLMVVKHYIIPVKLLWAIVGTIWSFSFIIVAAGVWTANNGIGHGGYFVRVDTWCWISSEYAGTRLWSHFGWILASILIIFVSYLSTAVCIRPSTGLPTFGFRDPKKSGHHPAFLIYPLVYFICCVPMALGPMILMAGVTIKAEYFVWAGAMTASNGMLDVIVWSCTMVFLAPRNIKEAGLEDFQFLRTDSVKYGNIVWVEGGRSGEHGQEQGQRHMATQCLPKASFSPFPKRMVPERLRALQEANRNSGGSGFAMVEPERSIQIETSTSVVVEPRRDSRMKGASRKNRRVSDIVSVPGRVAHLF